MIFGNEMSLQSVIKKYLIPIGMSYYTLQVISYLLDVYWGRMEAEQDYWKVLLFTCYFPQLVQGPISKYSELAPELFKEHKLDWKNIKYGVQLMFWGFFKKMLIADRIGIYVNAIFHDSVTPYGLTAWIGLVFYGIQLYCDFSGGIFSTMRVFHSAGIRLFEGIKYVLPILHPNKKRLALIMCPEEDSASVEWARQKGENWVNKDITSLEFVENIFRLMNWNRECRYKVLGRVANSDQGLCMLFDLEEAIMFTPKPQEYADPLTGEMKKKQMKFFPDTYRNRIGKSYNDYIADHQMNMFEDFIGYQGSAVLDEPVREEDSFSKESMSQESEISENILLPDLAKQSESIEQQSGEIAERGMPT